MNNNLLVSIFSGESGLIVLSQKVTGEVFENHLWRRIPLEHRGLGMGLHGANNIEVRFAGYIEGLTSVIGHADRAGPLRDYCTGLVMPCERKSVEPMAAITAPERTAAQHQSLLHFVGQGGWSDAAVLG